MKIQFSEDELRTAVAEHVAKVCGITGVDIDAITFTIGRNPTNITVDVDLDNLAKTVAPSGAIPRALVVTEEAVAVDSDEEEGEAVDSDEEEEVAEAVDTNRLFG